MSDISSEAVAPLSRLEYRLQTWSSFVVIPLFALANAGVDFRGIDIWCCIDLDNCPRRHGRPGARQDDRDQPPQPRHGQDRSGTSPEGTNWLHIVGLSVVGGIGFTVSLFIAGLAFEDPQLNELAKVGILAGSLLAGVLGSAVLLRARPVEQP